MVGKNMDEAAWKATRHEYGGVVADPLFVNASAHDFRLKKNSPAFALGYREWDFSLAGRK